MHWTAPGRALIAWDSGQGPHFARGPGGAYLKRKAFESFDVYRTADPAELTGILIGTTRAEAFFDTDAPEGLMVWYRVVGRTKDGGTIPVGARVPVIIPTRSFASADTMPPSPPDNFKVRPRSTGKLLTWHAACDAESGLLAYMVYDADQDQPDSVVWANDTVQAKSHAVRRFLDRTTNKKKRYRLRAIDCALNLSEGGPVAGKSADGWTVFTFSASSQFTIAAKETLDADTLIVAGGGSGGGGYHGGGGGGGEFRDTHDYVINAEGQGEGIVTVGDGGATVVDGATAGNPGEDSSFRDLVAHGGGYGSKCGVVGVPYNEVPPLDYELGSYLPGDGASGGGGYPYEEITRNDGSGVTYYKGYGGHAIHGDGGHDGGDCIGTSAWYNHSSGGGGGAGWPAYARPDAAGNAMNGGLGRPCDIAGWPLWEESGHTIRIIPWFCGGGAGMERSNNWSYQPGEAGYGGGGAVGIMGTPHTGGGGGGNGYYSTFWNNQGLNGKAPGPAGGSGAVIIRIRTADEDLVTYPLITGTDPDPEHNEFGLPVCLCDDPHVTIRRLPEYMTHSDEKGEEIVTVWGWPPEPYDRYGWEGTSLTAGY